MQKTVSATEILPIEILIKKGKSEVWLRRNIDWVEVDDGELGNYEYYTAEEVHGNLPYTVTYDEIEENFDEFWDQFDYSGLSDRQLTERVLELTQTVQAQIDFTAIMTDTVIEMEE